MRGACHLFYDWTGPVEDAPYPGCYLRGNGVRGWSPRAYLILSVRLVKSKVHRYRLALECERLRSADIPDGAPVYSLEWYKR